jgi:hypothetical protein
LVPDAGVGVTWFVPEPDADAAVRLLGARFGTSNQQRNFAQDVRTLLKINGE